MPPLNIDSELCDLDYSIYRQSKNVDDIFWVCPETEPNYVPITSWPKDCSLYTNDWECMSRPKQLGIVVLITVVVAVVLWAIVNALKPGTNKSSIGNVSSSPPTPEFSEQRTREKIAVLERLERLIDESTETTFVASPDEEIILIASGVHLVETRKSPSRFRGSSSGISVRLSKRVSVRSGEFSGESLPGASIPTIVDSGQFVVTTKRSVFTGSKETREFMYSKLLGINRQSFDASNSIIFLPVSTRKSVSGIGTGNASLDVIQNRLAIALELRSKTKFQMISELRSQIDTAISDDRD